MHLLAERLLTRASSLFVLASLVLAGCGTRVQLNSGELTAGSPTPTAAPTTKTVKLKTFLSTETAGYPVGVFNVNGDYLGLAAQQSDYVTLWNADSANQASGTLQAGASPLEFVLPIASPLTAVTGLRYWQIDANPGNAILCGPNDRILTSLSGGTIVLGSSLASYDSIMWTYTFGSHRGDWFGLSNTLTRRAWKHNLGSASTVTVFHNDDDSAAGISSGNDEGLNLAQTGASSNLRGNLPRATKNLIFYYGFSNVAAANVGLNNITNWSELTEVQKLVISQSSWNYHANAFSDAMVPVFTHMAKLESLALWGVNGFTRLGINKTNFPAMKSLVVGGVGENLSAYDFSTIPNITQQFVLYNGLTRNVAAAKASFASGHTYSVSPFQFQGGTVLPGFGYQLGSDASNTTLSGIGWQMF